MSTSDRDQAIEAPSVPNRDDASDEPTTERIVAVELGEPAPTSVTRHRALVRYPVDGRPRVQHLLTTVVSQRERSRSMLEAAPDYQELPLAIRLKLPSDAVVAPDPLAERGDSRV